MPLPADVRWILLDAVGTLIHPAEPVAATYQAVARQFGLELCAAEFSRRFTAAFSREFRGEGLSRAGTSESLERARWQRIVAAVLHEMPAAGGEPFALLWRHYAEPSSWRLYGD